MAGTVSELMEGLGIGLCIILTLVAFPWFLESATGGICSATQKIGKRFTNIFNRGGINNG